jgi:hypothetical protein
MSGRPLRFPLVLLAGAAVLTTGATSAAAASSRKQFTLYSVATGFRYVNHKDDRARGDLKNPFNADVASLKPPKESGKGPLAGDESVWSFKLYTSAKLTKSVGSAVYRCTYNFGRVANCDAQYSLNKGALFATGPIDFKATQFTLAVTGGTSAYFGFRGEVAAVPVPGKAERLEFVSG